MTKIAEPTFTLTSGPVDAYPAVLRNLSRTVLYDYDPAFQMTYEKVNEKAQEAMRLSNPPVILHGEPVLGLEAAAASLIARDDVVLNLASGVYGKGFGYWAKRYCAELARDRGRLQRCDRSGGRRRGAEGASGRQDRLRLPSRHAVRHAQSHRRDRPHRRRARRLPDRRRRLLLRRHGRRIPRLAMPTSSSPGPTNASAARRGLRCSASATRAWAKMKANPDAPRASMLSILDWEEAWRHDRPFPFTPSVAEINGLDAALDLYLEEGPENVWARHALTAEACRAGVKAMGLEIWPAREEIASPTTTAVKVPAGIADEALRAAVRTRYGVAFSSGRGETLGKLVRIGHMGPTAQAALRGDRARGARRRAEQPRAEDGYRRRRRRRDGGHRPGAVIDGPGFIEGASEWQVVSTGRRRSSRAQRRASARRSRRASPARAHASSSPTSTKQAPGRSPRTIGNGAFAVHCDIRTMHRSRRSTRR